LIYNDFYELFRRTLVVVVSPHPDDSVLGAGGLICRLTDRDSWARKFGDSGSDQPAVYTLVMTSGSRGIDDEYLRTAELERIRSRDQALADYVLNKPREGKSDAEFEKKLAEIRTEIRRAESQAEARELGVRGSAFLALRGIYYDHTISAEDRNAARAHVLSLRDRHPTYSLLFLVAYRDDMHPVHKLSTQLIVDIAEQDLHWASTAIWQYESPWITFSPHQVEYVVPFDKNAMETKVRAMSMHRSQEYRTRYSDVARYSAQMRAETFPELLGGFGQGQSRYEWDYIEAFQELRPVRVLHMSGG